MTREEAIEYARTWYKPTVMLLECDMSVIEALCSEDPRLALANRRIAKLRAGIHEADSYTDDAILVEGFHALLIADDALAREK